MRHRRWLGILCAGAMLLSSCLPSAAGAEEPARITVLVGLAYGSNVLPGANLKNDAGSGYRFGYLDENRNFFSLAYTAQTDISVVKTQNVYYGTANSYTSYSDAITSDILVGCWHVCYPLTPANYDEAQAAADQLGGFSAWIDGAYQVRQGVYGTQEEAEAAAAAVGGTVVGTSAYGVSVVRTGTNQVVFQFDSKKEELPLTVIPGLDDSGKTITWFKGSRYYGGFQYRRVGGGDLTVINVVDLDDYANCVISQEMSSSWPIEALKAQAICARTYCEGKMRATGRANPHKAQGFDICPTTDCQAYPGMSRTNERTEQAAAETASLRLWYNGEPIDAVYFSSDGGGTEDAKNVWGGTAPYLHGVVDPYEATVSDKIADWSWTVTYTASELTAKLQAANRNCATITEVQTELSPTGNVKTLTFVDANGKTWPFVRESGVRNFLGLRSMRYTVTTSGETSSMVYYTDSGGTLTSMNGVYAIGGDGSTKKLTGNPYVITGSGTPQFLPGASTSGEAGERTFTFQGSGWGHHVGMSQWGAYAMAQQGFTYDQILKFYYTGVEIY